MDIGDLVVTLRADTAGLSNALKGMGTDLRKSASETALAADLLRDRFRSLEQQFRTGQLGAAEYASRLRTLKADIAELASTTKLSAESQLLLANTGNQVTSQLTRFSGGMNRAVFGLQTLALGMEGGRVSAQGLTSALLTLGIGSPEFLAVMAGLALVGTLIARMGNGADEATGKFNNLLRSVHQLSSSQTRDAVAGEIAARERALARLRAPVTTADVDRFGELRDATTSDPDAARRDALNDEIAQLRTIQTLNASGLRTEDDTNAVHRARVGLLTHQRDLVQEMLRMQRSAAEGAAASASVQADALRNMMRGARVGPGSMDSEIELKAGFDPLQKMREIAKSGIQLGGVISSAFTSLGQSLAGGFKNIGATLKGILGGLMVTIGHSMIAFGAAGLAIKQFIKNPVAAIAAGTLLVALGSALTSSAQGAVDGGGSGGGGGGGGSPGVGGGGPNQTPQGNVTIIFPKDAIIDASNPRFVDMIVEIGRQAQGRNLTIERAG